MKKKLVTLFLTLAMTFGVAGLVACGLFPSESSSSVLRTSLIYQLSSDESYYIVEKGSGSDMDIGSDVIIPATYNGLPVTSIGQGAFHHCFNLTSITIPDSITSIGESAFSYCSSLTSVTFGENSQLTSIGGGAFQWCYSLVSVTIPSSVTSIGEGAFSYCRSLTSITLPSSVTSIGSSAFWDCSSLKGVYITDIAAWCSIDFGNDVSNPLYYAHNLYVDDELVTELVIPDSATSIGNYTFYNCRSLTSITIPDSVTSIGEWALSSCSSLTNITFGENSQLTSIGGSAFSGCSSLTNITFGENSQLTSIGFRAFNGCSSLSSITIPDSVTSIGNSAFSDCNSLKGVYITDIAAWCSIDFYHYDSNPLYYAHNLYVNSELITELVIPDSATSIGEGAFHNCRSLTSITIPSSVTSIGDYAFLGCSSLTGVYITDIAAWCSIAFNSNSSNPLYYADNLYVNGELMTEVATGDFVIPDGATSIPAYTFYNCKNLTSITIPSSVISIGEDAFYSCRSLTSVTFGENSQLTSIGGGAFRSCSSLTQITIPDSVTSIGEDAFRSCSSLTGIYITDIAAWCSIDFGNNYSNPLYYAKKLYLNDELMTEVATGDFVIPDGATSIPDYTFYRCKNLTSITIPASVTSIGSFAFWYCDSLTSITIPDSVTSIGQYAFTYCSSLTTVYYTGTESDWNTISISSKNSCLTSATRYYYSEETPTKNGNYWHYVDGVPTIWA